jgi:hypothetical protein
MIVLSDEDRAEIARFVARQPLRSAERMRTPALHACRVPNTPRRATGPGNRCKPPRFVCNDEKKDTKNGNFRAEAGTVHARHR